MGHIHASDMAEYAKDALETDKPWERWEASYQNQEYSSLHCNPIWMPDIKYRRKPKIILINGHEVPEPHRTPLQDDEVYWSFTMLGGATRYRWRKGDSDDIKYMDNGFVHLTREAAEKHFNALKSFTTKQYYD